MDAQVMFNVLYLVLFDSMTMAITDYSSDFDLKLTQEDCP
uniref:Uncharacterized protein n=1 Tax=Arundo donax TaxID=35708 RepID=A0A0A9BHI2_ARUDO